MQPKRTKAKQNMVQLDNCVDRMFYNLIKLMMLVSLGNLITQ
jgi:hypothetical protein